MRIREARKNKKMTQKQLAQAIGVSYTVISKYEKGVITPPVNRLESIAKTLSVSVDYLLSDGTTIESVRNNDDKLYHLNPYLVRMCILGANGKCEFCSKEAPFNDKTGRPYLEVHVIDKKYIGSDETKNLIALCPNCYKQVTVLEDPHDLETIKEIAAKHNY